jgi:hypothetical protein
MNTLLNKIKIVVVSVYEFGKKAVAGFVAVGSGVAVSSQEALAAVTIDATDILADIASVGGTVISVVLAIAAFTIAINMLRKGRS